MRKRRIACLLLTLALLASCGAPQQPAETVPQPAVDGETLEVYFLDVGQADAAVILCGGAVMMVDGGNRSDSDYVYSWLQKNGIDQIDVMVCSHAHEDHVGGLSGALNYARVKTAYAPVTDADTKVFQNYVKYLDEQNCPLQVPAPGDSWPLGTAQVQVLGPLCDYDETNDTSIVLKVSYGETSFLFTGDMQAEAEYDLLDAGTDVAATVLKVGHHGSDTSSTEEFITAVAPQYAVISVGRDNDYGHPAQQTLDRLARHGATVYRTDECGIVHCVSDGTSVRFDTEKGGASAPAAGTAQPDAASSSAPSDAEAAYIGNVDSKKFHLPDCSSLPAENNRIGFATRDEALAAGYAPCGRCKP